MRAAEIERRRADVDQLDVLEVALDHARQRGAFRGARRDGRVVQLGDAELVLHRSRRGRPRFRLEQRAGGVAQLDRFAARAELAAVGTLHEADTGSRRPADRRALAEEKRIFRHEEIADVSRSRRRRAGSRCRA